jgi:L-fuconolactonase
MATGHDGPNPHFPVRPDWLALHEETALEPDLPVIDPHHHLWDRPENPYLVPDLLADLGGGHRIVATVFAECGARYRADGPVELRPVGETAFAAAAATTAGPHGTRICAGIIGHADLRLGDAVEPVLRAHLAAGGGRFRGIRQISAWHADPAARASLASPPPGLLADPGVRRGAAVLARLGLSFDAYMYHTQLADLAALADAVPDLAIVLDHTGGAIGIGPYAGRRAETFGEWRAGMRALASRPNIHVKLGGMGMRLFGFGFGAGDRPPSSAALAAAWAPHVEACIEAFGAGRCMFESNFPVDKGSCSYAVLWNAFKRIAAGASAAEKAALFAGTAARVYRLGDG